ncbi:IucA/IucC family protein [Pseudomonas sp. 10B1]|uniref:IucA/IucC family protein n=1 Tax=unclassified Pseudomonas TaxID=196821 RepID=UPI002B22C7B1|nr:MULTISPECIES: IucA/IucC family protein [unclassified Pseudomonas]MEA9976461.1 IucA/IucC family protein [Pseudomonas sp. RTS4]MEA9996178.1 IucA/IucC family protein [Pseudomonas sp. AA4]MEB0088936.1 IucA/IucC family protein [Pseudomonas sp. RTI1]MEB0128046.1 IucA/IucC family protein [Pseudomonas sp. CCC1.2]MEB0154938.1 IucA/IucC family protein [Pseudomonas sp. CCC4.3]
MNTSPLDTDQAAISQRIIDCCLRENIRGLLSQGRVQNLPPELRGAWPNFIDEHWLRITHLGAAELWLPVHPFAPLQAWSTSSPAWICRQDGQTFIEQGYRRWLEHLGNGLDADSLELFAAYKEEADCAVQHRRLCQGAYQEHAPALGAILDHPFWAQRLIGIDQLASYLDHPFYPTARAKTGFDRAALERYAPEFAPRFSLNWLAVPKVAMTISSAPPTHWPSFVDLGLKQSLSLSHHLMPVHPMTWQALEQYGLPEGTIKAPRSAMEVEPTLSVRTVMCVEHPHWHLKLPLLVTTLGARNLRLIKPSTLYDGYWFQITLQALAQRDPQLGKRYLHVDEEHGGHADESRHLAYIARHYPAQLGTTTLVPVAALASPLADGRLFVEPLIERFYAGSMQHWLDDYLDLLLQVHLRLWLGYGIALEANQQNAVLIFETGRPLRLLMKDNDAARLWPERFAAACPDLAQRPLQLLDERICVNDPQALAEMFCTITLQLNIVAVLEAIIGAGLAPREALYTTLRLRLLGCLEQLEDGGTDCSQARRCLLDSPTLPVKYLLSAGSLFSKAHSGAQDINKFYGYSAANFLLEGSLCAAD